MNETATSAVGAALTRYWWVVAVGVAVGGIVALSMIYRIPSFESRNPEVHTAASRVFVTSAEGQYVRLSVPVDRAALSDEGATDAGRGGGGPAVIDLAPNVQPLLNAANLYPLVIEGDEVAARREKMFGPTEGTVRASAFSAVSTPQRFAPGQLPVIDILATSATPAQAIALAQQTTEAFKRWIRAEQNRARVKPGARILIQDLKAPREAFVTGGPQYGVPMLAFLAIVVGFGMLAILLDRISGQRAPAAAGAPVAPARATAEATSRRWS